MANEEIRGEVQDPRLIGASAPGSTLGLAGAVPGMGGLTPIAPPYAGGAQKVFETLPINGKKFSYDYFPFLANTADTTGGPFGGIIPITLLGPNSPYASLWFGPGMLIPSSDQTGRQLYGSYITLVRRFSAALFYSYGGGVYSPLPGFGESGTTLETYMLRLDVSGQTLSEYQFNSAGTFGEVDTFIPLNQTDTLTVQWGINLGAFPEFDTQPALTIRAHIVIEGDLIPDHGNSKELTVSL